MLLLGTYQLVDVISPGGSKKCLQNTPQCDSFSGLRVSETSEDNGTYWTSDLGLLDGVKAFPGLRVAKSCRKSASDCLNAKATSCVTDVLSRQLDGTPIATVFSRTYDVGKVEL